jgi:perosamine synthetase
MRLFRNHGISTDFRERAAQGAFAYEMVDLGFNYRLSDIQCALGISQLAKLKSSVARRQAIAKQYDDAFRRVPGVLPLAVASEVSHAYHLYVIRLELEALTADRAAIFRALRAEGIGVNVHYLPVHLHPYYQKQFGTGRGLCPEAEAVYERLLSLPMFPAMSDEDTAQVVEAVEKVVSHYRR